MAHIISKLNKLCLNLRVLMCFVVFSLFLSACSSFVPFQYFVSKSEIEAAMLEHLGKPKTFLGLYTAVLARPSVELLPEEQRIRVTQTMVLTERLSGRTFDGVAVVSAGLEVFDLGRAIKLDKTRIEKISAPGLAGGASIAQQAIATLLEPELDKFVLFKASQKEPTPTEFRIGKLQIEAGGLLLSSRPAWAFNSLRF
jgi:hypothetical protein